MQVFPRSLRLVAFAAVLLAATSGHRAFAQNNDVSSQETDTPPGPFDPGHSSVADDKQQAWLILTDAYNDKHSLVRVQALAALGNVGDDRAAKMISDELNDTDIDVRTGAVLACGEGRQLLLIGRLHDMLDDKEPEVAFAAATTLWKMKDHSGEDILMAVANGDRPANATFVNGTMHTMNKDFHNPSTLTRMGALQGASFLLGPFGFGITAYEAMRKSGGSSARVVAIEQLAQERTGPVRAQLLSALGDKDPGVRASAAKALGDYHEPDVATALANLFIDSKPPVRYTAAAAYLHSTGAAPAPATPPAVAKPASKKR
ncbi:HEAT repeat domain-containing protein [Granulicella sibirica]|uniref:PBS lyase HEAT domain protein repeat-containing protein n=1 Tax=Granulicella sibirica TaxID=2479048 RepID=A0A4Q0T2I8_9BACT|nr:HEAT repeat domain-containing protein [Granulicella sibirica]RXH57427.1 PBS lyase HEAT domain protein repeat-containing protein [Granulicella sibirica]